MIKLCPNPKTRLLAGIASGLLLLPVAAHAQAGPDAAGAEGTADEIVVTATRRSEDISKVPIAIEQIGGKQITELRIQQPIDLQGSIAGLTIVNTFSDATPIFSIRGVSADDIYPTSSSPIGVYYDDVYAASPLILVQPVFDLERVEVLKGPQGTLYGRNTPGGAINFLSRKPSQNTDGYLRVGYGRWDTVQVEGAVGAAINEAMSFRLSGTMTKAGEGYQKDLFTGREFGKPDRGGVRGQLLVDLSDNISLLLNGHYSWDRSTTASPFSSFFYTGNPRDVTVGDLDLKMHSDAPGGSATFDIDLGGMTLKSITAYEKVRRYGFDNYDGLSDTILDFYNDFRGRQFSQELRLSSDEPIGGVVDWILGLTYGKDRIKATIVQDLSDVFYPDGSATAALQANYVQKSRSLGAYAHLVAHLTETLNLTTGLRYSDDRRSFVGVTRDTTGGYTFSPPGTITAQRDESRKSDNVSFRVGLDWTATPAVLLYGSLATGYKQGAFYGNAASTQEAWGFTRPEKVTSGEIGFKGNFLDRHVLINGAVFYSDYKDRQTLVAVQAPFAVTSALANIPKSRSMGFEVDATIKPAPGFTLSGSWAYVDTKIKDVVTDVRGLPVVTPISSSDPLPQTPEISYNIRGRYEWAIGSMTASLQADYSWLDKALSALGDANAGYGPIPMLGASAMLVSDKGWSLQLWGRNLTDERRHTYGFTSILGDNQFYIQKPRSYGVTLGYEF